MAGSEDVVSTGLPRGCHLSDAVQRLHGLLHLCHAHLLVPVRLRRHGRPQVMEPTPQEDGRQSIS